MMEYCDGGDLSKLIKTKYPLGMYEHEHLIKKFLCHMGTFLLAKKHTFSTVH